MATVFFNLFVNSVFSLVAGLMVVGFFLWLFRIGAGPWRVFLLSLPFVKVVIDFMRGLPTNSILLSGVDPFALPPKHQLLTMGFGFDGWMPSFQTRLSVQDLSGRTLASSIGDYLVIWSQRIFGEEFPALVFAIVLTISGFLIARRIVQSVRFEGRRRRARERAESLKRVMIRGRSVDVFVSEDFSGSPFTGGIFQPFICFPRNSYQLLDEEERRAVIAHEIGHVRHLDVVVTSAIQILGDFFWFIPGYRWLSRRIDRLREIVADQWAVRSGASALALAAALVKLQELPSSSSVCGPVSAFFREKSLLKERVRRLLGESGEEQPRWGWQKFWIRWPAVLMIFASVVMATFGGNHTGPSMSNPESLERFFQSIGL